jgi:hypothetical protein
VERGQRLALELGEDRFQQQVGIEQSAIQINAQWNRDIYGLHSVIFPEVSV